MKEINEKKTIKKNKKGNKKATIVLAILILLLIIGTILYLILKPGKNAGANNVEESIEEIPVNKVKIIDLDSDSRPYAVMINNNSAVWKYQSGLMDAYIVYEMLVEGGITREMAIFKDADTSKIASIRSSRHYFLDYALENDAIYVHWGWSPQAQSDISSLKINNINGLTYENTYFFRDKSLPVAYEHKGYTTMESLKKATEKLKYRSTSDKDSLLEYSAEPIDLTSYEDAKYIEIKFSNGYTAKFTYNEENKNYIRKQNKTDMIDYTSKEKFTAKNIIIYNVGYSNISGDEKGRQNMDNVGSGTGYYISEGKSVPIKWSKSSRSAQTSYTLEDGSNLIINDGNTYIELEPNNYKASISAEIPA